MSPLKVILAGLTLYFSQLLIGFYCIWYIRRGYNVSFLSFLIIVQIFLSFLAIILVGYGVYSYIIRNIKKILKNNNL